MVDPLNVSHYHGNRLTQFWKRLQWFVVKNPIHQMIVTFGINTFDKKFILRSFFGNLNSVY